MKKIILILTLIFAVSCLQTVKAQTWASGECTVTFENGVLTISPNNGISGAMENAWGTPEWKAACMSTTTSIIIKEGVTSIRRNSFEGFSLVTEVVIPNTVTTIGNQAFNSCGITSIEIPGSVIEMNSAFYNCPALRKVIISEGVTTISASTFYIPSGFTSGLEELIIGSTVTSIGSGAFFGCTVLKNITCKAAAPPAVTANSFDGAPKDVAVVHVPCSRLPVYTQVNWGDFANFSGDDDVRNVTDYYCENATTYTGYGLEEEPITGSGPYEGFVTGQGGCITTYMITLAKRNTSTSIDEIIACNNYTWIDDINYTENNNVATYMITNQAGCDSIVTLNLTIIEVAIPALTITQNDVGFEITWQGNADSYALYRDGDLLEEGIAATSYTDNKELVNGEEYCYTIVAFKGECESEISAEVCSVFGEIGIIEPGIANIKIYPNPTNGELTIENCELLNMNVEIYDVMGRALNNFQFSTFNSQLKVDVSALPVGIYTLRILSEGKVNGNYKIVKQ